MTIKTFAQAMALAMMLTGIFAVIEVAFGKEESVCAMPAQLPQWNELVLRLWASDRISSDTFLKNFPISGEHGDRFLSKQGYDPKDLPALADCLFRYFWKK